MDLAVSLLLYHESLYHKQKSDISYLKTSRAIDVEIHSRALLAAVVCWPVSDSVGTTSSCSLLSSVIPSDVQFTLINLEYHCIVFIETVELPMQITPAFLAFHTHGVYIQKR